MTSEHDELARLATAAARAALVGWSPRDPDSADRLASAIGEAVATALTQQEEMRARLTADRMAGISAAEELHNWQI